MTNIDMLLKAAKEIESKEHLNNSLDLITNILDNSDDILDENLVTFDNIKQVSNRPQSRSPTGTFLPKKYDKNQSKYIGVYKNENRWTVCYRRHKTRFNTKDEAEKFFISECIKNNINPKSKIREGCKKN
jgi:hypothetical protein